MKKPALLLLFILFAGAASADDAGLLRCRAITDGAQRLVCYDALEVGMAPVAARPGTAATPAAPAPGPDRFGLPLATAQGIPEAIESRIAGYFEGWRPMQRIRLANGQVWQVIDDSQGVHDIKDPKVTIRRGALGAYYMEIEGRAQAPGVKRVQ